MTGFFIKKFKNRDIKFKSPHQSGEGFLRLSLSIKGAHKLA